MSSDISGTIAAGGTAQALVAGRKRGVWLQNRSNEALYVTDQEPESLESVDTDSWLKIPPGGYYESPPGYLARGTELFIYGATTGQKFVGRVW
jgi:hypothetical protein